MKRYGTKGTSNRYAVRLSGHKVIGSGRSQDGKEARRQMNRRLANHNAAVEAQERDKCAIVRKALTNGASEDVIRKVIIDLWPTLKKTYKRKSER